jgi:hypothetical protein
VSRPDRPQAGAHQPSRDCGSNGVSGPITLIALLTEDPPVPDAQISARLGIPVGSIGPYRGRCLNKLRRHPAVADVHRVQMC